MSSSDLSFASTTKQRLLVLSGVIILAAVVWLLNNNANQPAKPTAAWKTVAMSSQKLHFKLPPSWTVSDDSSQAASNSPQSISIVSPSSKGYYFSLEVSSGGREDVYKNFLGQNQGVTLLKLPASSTSMPLYLVAQGTKQSVTGLALAGTPGGSQTDFGINEFNTMANNNLTMSANLVTAQPTAVPRPYSLKMYQSQPEYKDVLGIFNSLDFAN